MWVACRLNRVHRYFDIAVSAVLETHGAGQAGTHFPVQLAFGGACTDGAPGHQIRNVLRGQNIQVFHPGRHARLVQFQQQTTRGAQAFINLVAVIQVRVIDQTFPTHCSARFFKIHPHDDGNIVLQFIAQGRQALGIVFRRHRVMNRAGAYNGE